MIDEKKIEAAVRLFLEGIGEDPEREGLKETPVRIAHMCHEIYGGMEADVEGCLKKTFAASGNEMVLEKDITFYSTCEHHLLPFYGRAHVAYLPGERVVGLSKLARTVDAFARRAQIQEQMTAQIAGAVMDYLQPKGVMVVVEAEHMCMTMRGIKKPGSRTMTYKCLGEFEHSEELRRTVFENIRYA